MTAPFEVSFLKAMQLLHSPTKDATEQLKAMLDESLAQKKAPPVIIPKQPPPPIKPVVAAKPPPPPQAAPTPILVPTDDSDPSSSGCVVCKRVDQSMGNEIVECQECRSLYHQECHKPSLANEDVKDPRFIWYCSTCTNKRKRAKVAPKPSVSATTSNAVTKDTKDQHNVEVSPFKSWSFLKK